MTEQTDKYYEEEKHIAEELRKICDKKGNETDAQKSAQKLYELGQVYRKRSPNKFSLIKSVGLLNAAIFRNPSNVNKVEEELSSLCKEILKLAHAVDTNADLREKAKDIKSKVEKWRTEMQTKLQHLNETDECKQMSETETIEGIKELQQNITDGYTSLMADIAQYCSDVMGKAPCKFSIVGMGSLARKEVTPFSDFEHVIVLEDQENSGNDEEKNERILEYFCWFSVIFHVVVLNLQETIVPSLDISSLNDPNNNEKSWFYDSVTPRGISLDGMTSHACKFPLGRQKLTKAKPFSTELIKPISQMLDYLTSTEKRKNGYHLKDILTNTCFVFGDDEVYKKFNKGVEKFFKNQHDEDMLKEIKEQVKEDLDNFAAKFKLEAVSSKNDFNVKQTVYRSSTLFVTALGRIHKIHESSCFDIIECLAEKEIITEDTKHDLLFGVAVACKIRLKSYFKHKKQQDYVSIPDELEDFLQLVETTDLIKYFQIAYCLQAEICKELKIDFEHSYSHPELLNIIICHVFGLEQILQQLLIKNKYFLDSLQSTKEQMSFDESMKLLTEQVNNSSCSNEYPDWDSDTNLYKAFNFFNIGFILFLLKESNDASLFFTHFVEVFKLEENEVSSFDYNEKVKKGLKTIEEQLKKLSFDKNSRLQHKQLNRLYQRNFSDSENSKSIARMLDLAGFYLYELEGFENSLYCCEQALLIYEKTSADIEKDNNIALIHDNIGMCLQKNGDYKKALLQHHKKAFDIYKKIQSTTEIKDKQFARVLENMGDCYHELEKYKKALSCNKKALLYYVTATDSSVSTTDYFPDIARVLDNVGECLRELGKYKEALDNHFSAYRIHQHLYKNKVIKFAADRDEDMARILDNIGDCKYDMEEYEVALVYYQKALSIYCNLSPNNESDRAQVLDSMGESHRELGNYHVALDMHNQALQIYEKLFPNEKREEIAVVSENIGECYMHLKSYDNALESYKNALEIYNNLPSKEGKIAETKKNIAECYKKTGYEKAVIYYKDALQFYQNTDSKDDSGENNIAVICKNIAECYKAMGDHDEAEKYQKQAFEAHRDSSTDTVTDTDTGSDDSDL